MPPAYAQQGAMQPVSNNRYQVQSAPRGMTSNPYAQQPSQYSNSPYAYGGGAQPQQQQPQMQWVQVPVNGYQPQQQFTKPKSSDKPKPAPQPATAPAPAPASGPQPIPYPEMPAPKPPAPPSPPANANLANEVESLKNNDRLQDRRLAALEGRSGQSTVAHQQHQQQRMSQPQGNGYGYHTVCQGETMPVIAANYGMSVSELKLMNHKTSSLVLPGERLMVPSRNGGKLASSGTGKSVVKSSKTSTTHVVRRGESLTQIAHNYHVSVNAIQSANGIKNANVIAEGRKLTIPGGTGDAASISSKGNSSKGTAKTRSSRFVKTTPTPEKGKETVVFSGKPSTTPTSAPVSVAPVSSGSRGVTSYRVSSSDKIETIAKTFSTTPAELQKINNFPGGKLPATGEEIIVPLPASVSL